MALLWIDGFDHYTTTPGNITNRLGAYTDPGVATRFQYATNGLIGGCLSATNTTSTNYVGAGRLITAATRKIGVGAHFRADNITGGSCGVFGFATAAAAQLLNLVVASDGTLQLRSGAINSGTVIATTAAAFISTNVWYHIECQVNTVGAASTYEVRVNGVTAFSGTTNVTNVDVGVINILGKQGSSTTAQNGSMDNFYIYDLSGTENNDWLGERNVYTLHPDADGAVQTWTRSTGTTTWGILDNVPPLPATAYIEANASGLEAQVTIQDLPSMDLTPIGIQINTYGEKTGTSPVEVSAVPTGATAVPRALVQDEPRWFRTSYENNPATGQPWTPSELNALSLSITRTT